MDQYDHKKIEPKWQKRWAEEGLYRTENSVPGKKNFYTLVEFPYPSGDLHVGHWAAFSVPDIFARMKRMQGYNVLYPIGFDSFGLPAEDAAIKHGADPAKWTGDNIVRMRGQLTQMGNMFDWSREVSACDPNFYQWTQWLFLRLFEKKLAYKKKALVNWDPIDKTVLANEQVLPDGTAERSGAKVEKKELEQWFLKITDYADRLIDDLDALDWPEPIKEAQRNWIGRSEGTEIDFEISQKFKFVLLHGFTGNPNEGFFVNLRKELESRGHEVIAPELPNPDAPREQEWVAAALNATTYDKNTILLGWSLGAVTALKVLEKINSKIFKTVLVGGFIDPKFKDHSRNFESTFSWRFDWKKIHESTGELVALHDVRDPAISIEQADRLEQATGIILRRVKAEGEHFDGETEPEVVQLVLPAITVFTTRPDTLFGATYLVLAPEHPLIGQWTDDSGQVTVKNKDDVVAYVKAATRKGELERQENKEKTGVELKDVKAINPGTKEEIPIFIADYVLSGYGTGAIMAVPAHDERDFEFAGKYNLPTRQVVTTPEDKTLPYMVVGALINSDSFDGLEGDEAKKKITESVGGRMVKTYRQRDWLISRQRYWGTPIPIVYDPSGKPHAVPDEHLPWLLPTDVDFTPTGEAPLARSKELKERTEKLFGKGWTPEMDTMDTFVDSSWYFLRYLDPKNEKEFCSKELQKVWMPVNRYSGGAEHTTMHILYSRFFYKALYDLGLVTESEPYKTRMNRGLILAEDGRKMSKRWGNTVNPDEQVANVGADSVKTYLAFIGPYNEVSSYPWSTNGLVGVRRFLERVWNLQAKVKGNALAPRVHMTVLRHRTIKKVGDDIESMKFNTSVSALMIYTNELQRQEYSTQDEYETLLKLLAPFTPHMAEELWEKLGHTTSIHLEPWPEYDPGKALSEEVSIAVQFGGKTRGTISLQRDADESMVTAAVKADEKLVKYLDFKPQKVFFVPNKIINFLP